MITDFVNNAVAKDSLLIWGTGNDTTLGKKISVTIIATGFESNSIPELYGKKRQVVNIPLVEGLKKSASSNNMFEVKSKDNLDTVHQRAFDFSSISNASETDEKFELDGIEVKINKSKSNERLNVIKKNQTRQKEQETNKESSIIEDLENQPAFVRKKINIEELKSPSGPDISKFTLSDDDEKKIVLKSENPYLNDNVD